MLIYSRIQVSTTLQNDFSSELEDYNFIKSHQTQTLERVLTSASPLSNRNCIGLLQSSIQRVQILTPTVPSLPSINKTTAKARGKVAITGGKIKGNRTFLNEQKNAKIKRGIEEENKEELILIQGNSFEGVKLQSFETDSQGEEKTNKPSKVALTSSNSQTKSETIVKSYAVKTRKGFVPSKPNKVNQDSYAILKGFANIECSYLFGVMDGHGTFGQQVSDFVKTQLPGKSYLTKHDSKYHSYRKKETSGKSEEVQNVT